MWHWLFGQAERDLKHWPPYEEWRENLLGPDGLLSEGCTLESIKVPDIYYFGKRPGLVRLNVDMCHSNGMRIPGAVFMRGPSMAVLITTRRDGYECVVLVEQARVPIGRMFKELPAGIIDDDLKFTNKALQEVLEEAGLSIQRNKLRSLGLVYPSPGGCNECIELFHANMEHVEPKCTAVGMVGKGEHMLLHIIPLEEAYTFVEDGKFWMAMGKLRGTQGRWPVSNHAPCSRRSSSSRAPIGPDTVPFDPPDEVLLDEAPRSFREQEDAGSDAE